MTADNPFFYRSAIRRPADFCGREQELEQILGLLRHGQSVSLIGPRRIGKSSLLIHLCLPNVRAAHNLEPAQALFVLVDCQELGGSPPDEVYERIIEGLAQEAEQHGMSFNSAGTPGTYRMLDRALFQLAEAGTSVVVLLDEFELLAANGHLTPYFFARLRGLTTKYGLAFLTASQRPLFAVTAEEEILSSPFFNIFVTVPLGLYTEHEARRLFERRLAAVGSGFSVGLMEHLLALVGYHPYFLHLAGYHAYQAQIGGDLPGNSTDFSVIDSAVEVEADSHLSYLWHNLTAEEQHALAIADGPVDSLRLLEQQCLLARANGGYSHTSEILRRFIRRQEVEGLIQSGPFVIDLQRHQVWGRQEELTLTSSQFRILVKLCQHLGQVVGAEELELAVWEDVPVKDPFRLKTLIKRLRRAVAPYDDWIVSERGVGYALRPPE